MTAKRMEVLVSRYGVPSNNICKVPSICEYVSMLRPLEIDICEETFKARFRILVHLFIEELLCRYGLMLA